MVVGCATNDKPDIDPTGTVFTTLTWGGGNCAKTGTEPFKIFIARSASSYEMTTDAVGQTIHGNVFCGPEYCEIQFFKSWENNNNDLLHLDGTLTLDGDTNEITGTGKYDVLGDCEQVVSFKGALQKL